LNNKVHYRTYNSVILSPSQSQTNPIQAHPANLFKIHFNIVLPYQPRPWIDLLPSDFLTKLLYLFLLSFTPAISVVHLALVHSIKEISDSSVYWTVHHIDSWVKRDQLDVICFIISLFNAQHVSDVNTSILRSLRLILWVISWVVLLWFDVCWCYVVVWLGWHGIRMQAEALFND